jgi:taspase (threonine aspartase 1)
MCSAAQLAMLILKNGGSALDAVEAAIKTLEDREITNAGYGSNLAMDGVVECDASVVDHFGRSGAVGAVARRSLTMTTYVTLLTSR